MPYHADVPGLGVDALDVVHRSRHCAHALSAEDVDHAPQCCHSGVAHRDGERAHRSERAPVRRSEHLWVGPRAVVAADHVGGGADRDRRGVGPGLWELPDHCGVGPVARGPQRIRLHGGDGGQGATAENKDAAADDRAGRIVRRRAQCAGRRRRAGGNLNGLHGSRGLAPRAQSADDHDAPRPRPGHGHLAAERLRQLPRQQPGLRRRNPGHYLRCGMAGPRRPSGRGGSAPRPIGTSRPGRTAVRDVPSVRAPGAAVVAGRRGDHNEDGHERNQRAPNEDGSPTPLQRAPAPIRQARWRCSFLHPYVATSGAAAWAGVRRRPRPSGAR